MLMGMISEAMNRPTPNPPAEPATERLPPHKVLKDYYGEEQARRPYIDHLFDVSAGMH